jgi:CRP-like cAMP-binding protein
MPWPELTRGLLRRAAHRTRALNVQRAIAAQPRLEVRLSLLLWHLAARWGKVEPGGIRLPIPLTHQLLGKLVGAERPSVSNALARLAQAGLVTGHGDEWHLHGSLEQQLQSMIEPDRSQVRTLFAEASPPRL